MDRYLCDVLVTMDGPVGDVPEPIIDGAVDVGDDGRIVWCGPAADAPDPAPDAVHRTGILMPSLVNTHCHTPMVLLRGAGEGLPVDRWLHEVMWPRESKLTPGDVRAGMLLGAAEMLANGITATVEMYFAGQAMAEAAEQAGMRCLVTPGVIEDPDFTLTGPWPDQIDEMAALRDRWADSDLIDVGMAAHAAYSVSRECLTAIADQAAETGMAVHIHLAEQQWEDAAVRERSGGLAAPEYLETLGLLDGDVIAAHGVWLTPDDIEVLARNDTAVVHCPCSNAKHASGVAPVTEMQAAGLRLAIGTDGPASHHRLDLFEEMRTAIRTARIRSGDAQDARAGRGAAHDHRRGRRSDGPGRRTGPAGAGMLGRHDGAVAVGAGAAPSGRRRGRPAVADRVVRLARRRQRSVGGRTQGGGRRARAHGGHSRSGSRGPNPSPKTGPMNLPARDGPPDLARLVVADDTGSGASDGQSSPGVASGACGPPPRRLNADDRPDDRSTRR